MKIKLLLILLSVFVAANGQVEQDMNNLMTKINQVNQDLIKKQKQAQSIDQALADSTNAISQSDTLLAELRQKRSLDQSQLDEINQLIPQITSIIQEVQNNVKLSMSKIYQQINLIQNSSNSILEDNNQLQNSRRKTYLIQLLQIEQTKYNNLQAKLDQLTATSTKIQNELNRLNSQLGITTNYKKQLQVAKQVKIQQAQHLHQQISQEQKQLNNLKEKQAVLNQFMTQMAAAVAKARTQTTTSKNAKSFTKSGAIDQSYEDNSTFLTRNLASPIQASVAVPFGAMRGGVKNNGILFAAPDTAPVYSISNGKVMYAGTLAGFGQMVIIDNGDNYTSIYAGILPQVQKGQNVTRKMVIASAGNSSNQPMGGVYFELRHLGQPVNPTKLVSPFPASK